MRLGQVLVFIGQPAEAIAPIERCLRLSPYDSQVGVMLGSLALAHYQVRDYDQAAACARAAMHQSTEPGSVVLAASLAQLGRLSEARAALPPTRWQAGSFQRPMAAPYADPTHFEHLRQGVRLARQGDQVAENGATSSG